MIGTQSTLARAQQTGVFDLDERRVLAEKARGIDPETLKQISVLDHADLNNATSSTEYP
ncbi:MAG: hypothetical protein KDA75_21640 [Planctomycetaceae bacterium]|nr:hypothetical protein [Planctomycetaceae bacterium]